MKFHEFFVPVFVCIVLLLVLSNISLGEIEIPGCGGMGFINSGMMTPISSLQNVLAVQYLEQVCHIPFYSCFSIKLKKNFNC